MAERAQQRRARDQGEHPAPTTRPTLADRGEKALGQGDAVRWAAAGVSAHPLAGWQGQVLAGIPDAVIVTDRLGHVLEWNPAAERMYGYTRAEMLGQMLARVYASDASDASDVAALSRTILDAVARDGSWSSTTSFVRKDGTRGVCAVTVSPLRDEHGAIVGVYSVSRDITERERAEHLLTEQNTLLELIATGHPLDECLAALTSAVARLQPGTRAAVLLADGARTRFQSLHTADIPPSFGAGLKDAPISDLAIGTCGTAVYSGKPITCGDIAHDERWSLEWRALCVAHGILACHSEPVIGADGLPLASLMLCFAAPRAPSEWEVRIAHFGAHVASIAIERDRAERAASENKERLTLALRGAAAGAWETDLETGKTIWGENMATLLGVRGDDAADENQQWLERVHPRDRARMLAAFQAARQTDDDWNTDFRIVRPDGTIRWFNSRGAVVALPGGQRKLIGVAQDVTERMWLEEEVRAKSGELRRVMDTAGVGLTRCGRDLRYLSANPMYAALVGLPLEAIVDRPIVDVMGEEGLEAIRPYVERVLRGERVEYESDMPYAEGGVRHIHVVYMPDEDDTGAIIGWVASVSDITERKRLEEELRQSEQRLRAVLEVLPVGVSLVDATGRPQLVNDAVRQIWGQNLPISENREHYGAYRAWRADTGAPVAVDAWGLTRALTRGEVTSGDEYDIETFDGQRKAILDSAAPIRDERGAIIGAVSVIVDITDRRHLEQRTRDALEAFAEITQTLVEAPDDAPAVPDAQDRPDAETAASAMAGVTSDHPMPPSARAGISPLALRLVELTRVILGCSRVAVTTIEEVDGRLYDWPVAIVGMTPEMERHWWAVELAARPRELGVGMVPEDRERLLSGEAVTFDLTRPPYQAPNEYGITTLLAVAMRTQGRVVGLLALDFMDPSGQPHVFTREEIEIAEAAARLGAVVLERDRLLRERAEAQARELVAVEAARRMDEFLSIVSHELRTPLTTIKVNLQMSERRMARIRADWPGEPPVQVRQLSRLLASAVGATERQERLVLDLLDVSRITAGKLEYRMEPMELTALAREVVEELRLAEPARTLSLSLPRAAVPVYGDADRLRQVLANYLTNALKYSPPDRPVAVALRRQGGGHPGQSHPGQSVRVEVRDEGPGLTPEQRRHLFERFHRVPGIEVQSGSGIGLGLGLYISRAIVEQHGGEVGVESVPGGGSTFWFTVPLLSLDEKGRSQRDTPANPGADGLPHGSEGEQ